MPAKVPPVKEEDELSKIDRLLKVVVPEGDPGLVLEWGEKNPEALLKIFRESKFREEAETLESILFEAPRVPEVEVPEPRVPAITPAEFYEYEFAPPRVTAEGQAIYPWEMEAWAKKQLADVYGVIAHGQNQLRALQVQAVKEIYPDMTPESFGTWIDTEEGLWEFSEDIRILGRTPESETLLYSLGATTEDIEEIFPVQVAPETTLGKAIDWEQTMAAEPKGKDWKFGTIPVGLYKFAEDFPAMGTFFAGMGDVLATSGGVARWLGAEGVGESLSKRGENLQKMAPPDMLGDFEWKMLYNPRFYTQRVLRALPFTLSLIPAAIGGAYAGVGVAGAVGLGTLGRVILGAIGAGVVARPLESALEAGSTYDRAIDMGMSDAEADKAADETFKGNMALTGLDAAQFALAFAPTPIKAPGKLLRTAITAGKITVVGLTEAGEEGYQDVVQRWALDEDVELDPEMMEAMSIGGIFGMGLGGAGDVFTRIKEGTIKALPPNLKSKFNDDKSGFQAQGFPEDQAELKALDIIAETPQGKKIVEDIIEEIKKEEFVKEQKIVAPPPEVPAVPEVITEDVWNISPVEDRASWARLAGLEGKLGSKEWTDLTTKEQDAIRLAREEIAPPIPEVIPEVKPEVFMTREQWETIPQTSRAKALAEAGLDREISEKGWDALTALEREALVGEVYIEPDAPLTPEQKTSISELATSKLLMTEEGKAKPGLRNLMKGLVGKNKIDQLTQSEAGTVTEALGLLEVKYGKPPKIPTTVGLITKEFADKIPHLKEIGIIEKVRPTRQVFEKMGLRKEIFEPAFEAEVRIYEELQAFRKEATEIEKLVGKDPERRRLVFRELENPGSQVGLTFNEKRAVNWFRKYFDDWADKLNLPQDKRRQNYVTHIFEAEISQELKGKHPLDPALIKALDWVTPKTIFNPFLQQRLGQEIGLKEDPFDAASAYEARALKVYHYEPIIQKIRVYEKYLPPHSARYLRNFITRITGRPLTIDRELNQTLNEFAERVKTLPGGEALAKHLTRGNVGGLASYQFTSALYFLWLGFKPTSAIRNLSQHTLIISEVGPINFTEGIRLRFTKEGKAALKESFVHRSRRQAFIPGIDASFTSRWTDEFREKALWMFRKADIQNVDDAFLGGYAEMKRMFPEAGREWWIKRGDEVAADTQYIYSQMGSAAWSQNAMGRTLSVLTTWPENWVELMTRFVKGRPSYVINEYAESVGKTVPKKNWLETRKAMLLYLTIVAMGFLIKEETRLKAWEYTGLTSLRYLADLAGGEFPALQYPGAVADVIVGFLTDDERRLKTGWANLKPVNLMGIIRSLDSVVSGEKDWLTLFFYLQGKDYKIKQLKERWTKEFDAYPKVSTPEEKLAYVKEHPEQAGWSVTKIRDEWRKDNPLIEAKFFVIGQFATLSTDKARAEVLRLIEEHKLDTELIDGYEKVFGVDTSIELSKFKNRLGQYEKLVIGKEAEYFTTNDFASEVNRLEGIMGRYKLEKDGNPLAVEYLRAKDQWEPYYDLEEADGRRLYRQQFPELEAQLYLWGKVASFENPKSAEILLGLMKKYDIPPEAISAFLDDPNKYDELFTQKFKLEQKWFDLTTEYENYGNSGSPIYIEDAEARKEAREKLKTDNSNWVADMRRIEAIDHDAPQDVVEGWVKRGHVVDEFSAGSSEAMVWLLDNPETHKWALDQKLLTDDGSGWNESVLRINTKRREKDNYYNTIETQAERQEYLLRDEDYRKDRRRREAYSDGFAEALIEKFVDYYELPVTGYRQERFLLENKAFGEAMQLIKGIDMPDPTKIPDVEYDNLLEKAVKTSEDLLRMDAYKVFFPKNLVEDYVTYRSMKKPEDVDLWYEDDWFLMEHKEFYQTSLKLLGWDRADFRQVPTREVFKKYQTYLTLPLGKRRDDYRFDNQDLDAWGQIEFGWTDITEKKRREELTALEEAREEWAIEEKEIKELEERLKVLAK